MRCSGPPSLRTFGRDQKEVRGRSRGYVEGAHPRARKSTNASALGPRWGSVCGHRCRPGGRFKSGVMEVLRTHSSFSVK